VASWLDSYQVPFSWSHSRAQLYVECQRKYYWRYYAPYGGNAPDEPGERALLYFLGRLTNVAMLVGSTVHDLARDSLRSARAGRPWLPSVYEATAAALLSRAVRASRRAVERGYRRLPHGVAVLEEHYFRRPFGAAEESAALQRAVLYAGQLRAHPLFQEAQEHAADLLSIDEFARLLLHGVTVHAVPDVLQRLPDGRLRVVDWKTGTSTRQWLGAHRRQLGVYALYVCGQWRVPAEAIVCQLAELHSGEVLDIPFTTADLEQTEVDIAASIEAMRGSLYDLDRNRARREDLPPLAPPDVPLGLLPGACRGCAYRQVCYGERVFSWGLADDSVSREA
jgi:CRISPR/Cas system-associated exonuclease Cas4 (RecB family)